MFVFELYKPLKAKIRGVLTGHIVAIVETITVCQENDHDLFTND